MIIEAASSGGWEEKGKGEKSAKSKSLPSTASSKVLEPIDGMKKQFGSTFRRISGSALIPVTTCGGPTPSLTPSFVFYAVNVLCMLWILIVSYVIKTLHSISAEENRTCSRPPQLLACCIAFPLRRLRTPPLCLSALVCSRDPPLDRDPCSPLASRLSLCRALPSLEPTVFPSAFLACLPPNTFLFLFAVLFSL